MRATLAFIRARHGTVEGYLTHIGFDEPWQARLRAALIASPNKSAHLFSTSVMSPQAQAHAVPTNDRIYARDPLQE